MVSVKRGKPDRETVKTICCAVAMCLMIPVIIINFILIFKAYVLKEPVADVFGYYPLISMTDESAPRIGEGDLIFCRKVAPEDICVGDLVTFFPENSWNSMNMSTVAAVEGDSVILRAPNDDNTAEFPAEKVIGAFRFSIPHLGSGMTFLSTIPGFLLCVVLPTILVTELYLRMRGKDAVLAEDEEGALLAELAALKAERERLLNLPQGSRRRGSRKREATRSRRGAWAKARRKSKTGKRRKS